jgi:hypothetical protein
MLYLVKCRADRCCLERIFGAIFCSESPQLYNTKSILGNIFTAQKWKYSFENYENDIRNNSLTTPVIKIFTGR